MPRPRTSTPRLPPEFAHLEPFVAIWDLGSRRERLQQRVRSEQRDLRRFYDAMLPSLDACMQHLGNVPPEELTAPSRTLLRLTLAFGEIAPAVELYGQPLVIAGLDPERFPQEHVPNMTPAER